jgi:hypothetical protein
VLKKIIEMLRWKEHPTLLYLVEDSFTESMMENLASVLHWRPRKADDAFDIVAYNSTASVVQRSLLNSDVFGYLQQAYIEPTPPELQEMLGPDFDTSFTDKWIVYGEGPMLPDVYRQFFIESGRLNFEYLHRLLKTF